MLKDVDIIPKAEGMRIPEKIIKKYGFGVFINYPKDEFVGEYIAEFGTDNLINQLMQV
jgi:hypothetical protein